MPAAAGSYQIYVNDGDVVIDHSRSRRQTITREIIIEQEPTVIIASSKTILSDPD